MQVCFCPAPHTLKNVITFSLADYEFNDCPKIDLLTMMSRDDPAELNMGWGRWVDHLELRCPVLFSEAYPNMHSPIVVNLFYNIFESTHLLHTSCNPKDRLFLRKYRRECEGLWCIQYRKDCTCVYLFFSFDLNQLVKEGDVYVCLTPGKISDRFVHMPCL